MSDLVFRSVSLEPNPVKVNTAYTIQVDVCEKIHGILTKSGNLIMTKSGKAIDRKGG